MAKKIKLVLVDGHAVIHRAFHAIPELSTKDGELVNAVYGFSLILLNMFRDLKPTHVAVTFDRREKTFRHKEFKEYKAKRVKAPEELHQQTDRIKEIVGALNIPIFEKAGFEADDLIATLASQAEKIKDASVVVVTGDLDTLQLVNDKVKVYSMRRGLTDTIIYDEQMVKERYGLRPDQMIDCKALRGDPSDNIPGVPGIGEKTATELVQKYDSLKGIYLALKKGKVEISPRYQELLREHQKEAEMSYKLVTALRTAPVKLEIDKCELHDFDRNKVVKIFQELGFKSLLAKIPTPKDFVETKQAELFAAIVPRTVNSKQLTVNREKYRLLKEEKEIKKLLQDLAKQKEIVIDTETDKLNGKIIGISFSYKEKSAYYIPWTEVGSKIQEARAILQNSNIKKIGHNLKYDYKILKREGVELKPIYFDTMIAAYLIDPGSRNYNLDRLAFVELGKEMIPIESLIGKGKQQKLLNEVPVEKVAHYSCEDSDMTLRLYKKLLLELKEKKLDKLFSEMEMPLLPIISQMEKLGIKIDKVHFKNLSSRVDRKIVQLRKKIFEIAGEEFNISSTQQLRKILFERLKIDAGEIRHVKTGLSTAASELEKMRESHEIIGLIFDYRELTKLKNTYLDTLPKLAAPDGRVHTNFNQTIAATGRFSSSLPNLQNIPIRTDLGNEIRKGFVAEKGKLFLSADYSQIELRVVAHIAGDSKMISAFKKGRDIHAVTAAEIFEVTEDNVTGRMRRVAKTINFGVLYGLSSFGMSERVKISRADSAKFIDKYFKEYPQVFSYTRQAVEEARKKGYAETILGRRRLLPEINSGVFPIRSAAERMAVNMPVQGTAADIIKLAMIEIDKEILEKCADCHLLLQVHDELLFEIPKNKIKTYAPKIKKIMENVVKLEVPIKVDISSGKSWGSLKGVL